MEASNVPVVGIVGGGQLGRMMVLEAPRLSVKCRILDPKGLSSPAGGLCESGAVSGTLFDSEKLRDLSEGCDVVTAEIEHLGVDGLEKLEAAGVKVRPSSNVLKTINDKLLQKRHFQKNGVPLPPYVDAPDYESAKRAVDALKLPVMLKSRKEGYDGKGNRAIRTMQDLEDNFSDVSQSKGSLSGVPGGLYIEGWVPFVSELAVMVVRSASGQIRAYPTVTAVQRDSICRVVLAPARCKPEERERAREVAMKAIDSLGEGAYGVFGVELFLLPDGQVLLNEVAPRPHNTGHYTQDACSCSQFENHLRAVLGMDLGGTDLRVGAAAMVNVLGTGDMPGTTAVMNLALKMDRATVHWYGKSPAKAGRKMAHVNVTADSEAELQADLADLLSAVGLGEEGGDEGGDIPPPSPLVGVIMGSDSDLPAMNAAVQVLKDFNVSYECDVVSAHRTPDKMMSYARSAAGRGLRCIIAGAGGAAHLPGMVASMTPLPVIGVPIKTSTMSGLDSLYSIVQMPRGIPVATVAIGNAQNAGLLAVRILACSRPDLMNAMVEYQEGLKAAVEGKSDRLLDVGSEEYLKGMADKSGTVNV